MPIPELLPEAPCPKSAAEGICIPIIAGGTLGDEIDAVVGKFPRFPIAPNPNPFKLLRGLNDGIIDIWGERFNPPGRGILDGWIFCIGCIEAAVPGPPNEREAIDAVMGV